MTRVRDARWRVRLSLAAVGAIGLVGGAMLVLGGDDDADASGVGPGERTVLRVGGLPVT